MAANSVGTGEMWLWPWGHEMIWDEVKAVVGTPL